MHSFPFIHIHAYLGENLIGLFLRLLLDKRHHVLNLPRHTAIQWKQWKRERERGLRGRRERALQKIQWFHSTDDIF